jgi:hypothetical protein
MRGKGDNREVSGWLLSLTILDVVKEGRKGGAAGIEDVTNEAGSVFRSCTGQGQC